MRKVFSLVTCPFQGEMENGSGRYNCLFSIFPTNKACAHLEASAQTAFFLSEMCDKDGPFLSFRFALQYHLLRDPLCLFYPSNYLHSLDLILISLSDEIFSQLISS